MQADEESPARERTIVKRKRHEKPEYSADDVHLLLTATYRAEREKLEAARQTLMASEEYAAAERRKAKIAADADDVAKREVAAPAVALADGLQLHLSSKSSTGYMGVTVYRDARNSNLISYKVLGPRNGGLSKCLGYYKTAVEGAICYAKHVRELERSHAALATSGENEGAPSEKSADAAEAQEAQAVQEVHAVPVSSETALAVGDDHAEREALRRHMRDRGLSVPDVLRLCASMLE